MKIICQVVYVNQIRVIRVTNFHTIFHNPLKIGPMTRMLFQYKAACTQNIGDIGMCVLRWELNSPLYLAFICITALTPTVVVFSTPI